MKIETLNNLLGRIAADHESFKAELRESKSKVDAVHSFVAKEFTATDGALANMAEKVTTHITAAKELKGQLTDVQISFFKQVEDLRTELYKVVEVLQRQQRDLLDRTERFFTASLDVLAQQATTMESLERGLISAEKKLVSIQQDTEIQVRAAEKRLAQANDSAVCRMCNRTVARFTMDAVGAVCANCDK